MATPDHEHPPAMAGDTCRACGTVVPSAYQLTAREERAAHARGAARLADGIVGAPWLDHHEPDRLRELRQAIGRRLRFGDTYGHPPRWLDQLMDRPDPAGLTYTASQIEREYGIGRQHASLDREAFYTDPLIRARRDRAQAGAYWPAHPATTTASERLRGLPGCYCPIVTYTDGTTRHIRDAAGEHRTR